MAAKSCHSFFKQKIMKKNLTKKLKLVEDKYKNHFKLNDEILKLKIEFSKLPRKLNRKK